MRHHPQELLAQKYQKSAPSSYHMGYLIPNTSLIFLSIFYEGSQQGFLLPTKKSSITGQGHHLTQNQELGQQREGKPQFSVGFNPLLEP